MARTVTTVIFGLLTLALTFALNTRIAPAPALGKFLDPFHGFWKNAEQAGPVNRSLSVPGLKGEVNVLYDSAGIPHIYAASDEDLYLAQGYITALDRLWQIEFQTHAAAGRISEIIGSQALDYDRRQRRLGMTVAAQRATDLMMAIPEAKMMAEQYAAGINARINELSYEELPFEYKLLDYKPETWTSYKSALLLKYMAQTLNMSDKDIEMTNSLKLFGKDVVSLLYPDMETAGDPIVDAPGTWNFKTITLDSVAPALPQELIASRPFQAPPADIGSNNWAVHGSRTATGSPILCSDPHLSLSLPSIWYTVHLQSPTVNTMGVSLPGSPAVIIGFNDSIAWAMTNAQRDLVDWYRIEFKDDTRKEYKSDDGWKTVNRVIETIKVRGGDSFIDTVMYTHHGPIVHDPSYHGDLGTALHAFRWIAHDPSEEIMTFYLMNRARNHAGYMDALNHYGSPAQNFVFASVSGDVAMRIQGKYPVRRPLEGKFVLDGTRTSQEWQAYIPNEQNVMYKNPARGFVSSANQYPVDGTYPYYVTATSWEAYRNRRINSVLSNATHVTPLDMMKLQNDTYNLKAAESLPVFLAALDSSTLSAVEKEAFGILKSWNYQNDINEVGASYYEAWWDALMPMIWDEMDSAHVAMRYPTTYHTIELIKTQPNLSFFDLLSTPAKESATDILRLAFSKGVSDVEAWKADHKGEPMWADFKDSVIGHLLRQDALSLHIRHGGNHDIVNAHSKVHGPSWRMVVSLEKGGLKAWGVYPGGQSGNPGSPFYDNMVPLWSTARYFNLHFLPADQLAPYQYSRTQLK